MAGNANSGRRKEKVFYTALQIELKAVEPDDQRGLRKIARNLIEQAEAGDIQAIKEIRDTLDGKPAQAIIGDNEADPVNVYTRLERVITHQRLADTDEPSIRAVITTEPL